MLSDEQLNKNTSLEDKKRYDLTATKKRAGGVKLIFFINCCEFFGFA
jgi:hypothetical protein